MLEAINVFGAGRGGWSTSCFFNGGVFSVGAFGGGDGFLEFCCVRGCCFGSAGYLSCGGLVCLGWIWSK